MSLKSRYADYEAVAVYLFAEAARSFPNLWEPLEKDLQHLISTVRARGDSVLTIELPAACKHLDRCLAEGKFSSGDGILTKDAAGGVSTPAFLGCLYELIFNGQDGTIKEVPDVVAIYFLRQLLVAFKKVDLPCPEVNIQREIANFIQVDAELPVPDSSWVDDSVSAGWVQRLGRGFALDGDIADRAATLFSDEGEWVLDSIGELMVYLDRVSGYIVSELGPYSPDDWSYGHGPGAVSNATRGSFKYDFTNWPERLDSAFPFADSAFHCWSAWTRYHVPPIPLVAKVMTEHSAPSKLIAVPKDLEKPRLIAAEPLEHMWCQQNLRHYMYERTARSSWLRNYIKFRDQTQNQRMAVQASIDGRLATVDLSAASDRISCLVAELFWRGNLPVLLSLRACRTHQCMVNNRVMSLRKFATMGNACTFPVQSLLFLGIAIACTLYARGKLPTPENIEALDGEVSIYGDDIVVPVECRIWFEKVMNLLWFKINPKKTYWTGRFRESCGVDAYGGELVTPAYYRGPTTRKPESVVMNVEVSNNFYMKGLTLVSDLIARTIPWGIPMVSADSGVFGFKSRSGVTNDRKKVRYNHLLQREEMLVLGVKTKSKRSQSNTEGSLLQFFTEDPDPAEMWASGTRSKPRVKLAWQWVPSAEILKGGFG